MSRPGLQLQHYRRLAELPPQALALMAADERRSSSLGPDWYATLEQTLFEPHPEAGAPQYALLLGAQGQVLCVLPWLRLPQRQGSARAESLSSCYTALYAPACAPELQAPDLAVLLRALRGQRPALARITFAPMAHRSDDYQLLLQGLRLAGWQAFEFYGFDNWFRRVQGDWATLRRQLDGRVRSTLDRKGRRFAAAGGRLELLSAAGDVERGAAAYTQVYAHSWKQPEPFPAFIPGFMARYAARGELRLGLAWLGEVPVAAQLWIVCRGRAEIHKLAYDEAHKEFSPGTLLTELLMSHVIDRDKVTEIDYLIGADPYKQLWMDQRRERWGIVAYNPRTFGGIVGLATERLGRLTKGLRRRLRALRPPRPKAGAAAR